MKYATELGHKVLAFTDHETIASWVKIENLSKNYPDLKVIRGNEIYLCRNGLNATNYNREVDRYSHFILLAKDLIGAKQIFEISTRAWKRSYMARGMRRVPTYYQDLIDVIGENKGHIIGSTACLGGALPTQILKGTSHDKLNLWISQMINIFGKDDFYIELQPSKNKEQIIVNRELITFAKENDLKFIITTDSHYLKKEDRVIHKAYLNSQNGDREVDDFYATTYMMDTEELESYMKYSFEDLSIVKEAYKNILDLADSCENYSILRPLKIPELKWMAHPHKSNINEWFEKIPYLETFYNSEFESDKELVDAIIYGIENHDDLTNKESYDEINECLKDTWESSNVNKARWSAYFLNLQSIIDTCWEAGTLIGPSRGSGGGFILLYVLNIIQLNSLRETTKCYRWRFLNPQRASVLDIDTDIEGGRRAQVLQHLREVYGEDRVANVATFRTEKSKSAILTACRGIGIDVDTAQYLASLIPADRGQLRSLNQCMYGDDEKGFTPIKQFIIEMNDNYPEVWKVASKIEGLINGSGLHAGGVVFVDEPFTETTALMRAPDGTICTQFELHDAEAVSLIKMDLLSVEAMDKLHNCLDLLCDYGYIKRYPTLKETYEKAIGVYNLERDDPKMWEMVWNHKINSLFQMEKQSGVSGIAISKPKSVGELAVLNSVIRLMASEKGAEQPLDMWARYRNNINEWYQEMVEYGLTEDEIEWLKNNEAITDGVCEAQEGLMSLLQEERLGSNSLSFADKSRKAIAKKQGKLFDECEKEFFKNAEEKNCNMTLVHYVWDVLLKVQRGYSFCRAHTLAYSIIALQEMNLAYKYPILFWDCACLISDAGGNELEETEEQEEKEIEEEVYTSNIGVFEEIEEDEDDDEEEIKGPTAKKKKTKASNYGKIAAAIGKMTSTGVIVAPPNINKSSFTFAPDIEKNMIIHGLSGITRVSEDLIKEIIKNRPYSSVSDFISKVKVNKTQMINLIKSGAFDDFGDRAQVMKDYIASVSDLKKRITLQNMKMLIDFKLLPDDLSFECRVYNFNKYLKKLALDDQYFGIDNIAFNFLDKNFQLDILVPTDESESGFKISKLKWDKIYKSYMEKVKVYIKNTPTLLDDLNNRLISDNWNKYCEGSLSKWEMDSISCYVHEHELKSVENEWDDFSKLPNYPIIERYIPIKGHMVPIMKLCRIAGTVLDRNKQKRTVILLTTTGVVEVKIYGDVFNQYDRQLSEKDANGVKHVLRKSEFSRGNKIIITGVKDGDNSFRAKKYSKTPWHLIETIQDVVGGRVIINNRNDED